MVRGGSRAGETLSFWAGVDDAAEEGWESRELKKSQLCSLHSEKYGPGASDVEKA